MKFGCIILTPCCPLPSHYHGGSMLREIDEHETVSASSCVRPIWRQRNSYWKETHHVIPKKLPSSGPIPNIYIHRGCSTAAQGILHELSIFPSML